MRRLLSVLCLAVGLVPQSNGPLTVTTGVLSDLPQSGPCGAGSMYIAQDQPLGRQLYICETSHAWIPVISLGGSGGLAIGKDGSLDLNTAVVPRLQGENRFTGLNTFAFLQLAPSPTPAQPCAVGTVGGVWLDSSDAANYKFRVCMVIAGKAAWSAR